MSSPSPGGLRRIDSFKVHTPREVLEFWFPTATFEDLSSDLYIQRMMDSIWPGLGFTYEFKVRKNSETENEQPIEGLDSEEPGFSLYDECENFLPAMQAAARMKLGWTEENDQAVLARVLLLDQMFSILHRGRGQEFPFLTETLVENCGDMARAESRRLIDDADKADVLPLAYLMFLISPLMRSEDMDDQVAAEEFVKRHEKAYGEKKSFQQLVQQMQEHRNVLKRFKRFPHRNAKCARKTTPQERAWLDNKEFKPKWAQEKFVFKLPMRRTTSNMSDSSLYNHTIVSEAKIEKRASDLQEKAESFVAKKNSSKTLATEARAKAAGKAPAAAGKAKTTAGKAKAPSKAPAGKKGKKLGGK